MTIPCGVGQGKGTGRRSRKRCYHVGQEDSLCHSPASASSTSPGFSRGPSGSVPLADMGVEVIKIESPGEGDPVRQQGVIVEGLSWYFAQFNRNRKSRCSRLTPENVGLRNPAVAGRVNNLRFPTSTFRCAIFYGLSATCPRSRRRREALGDHTPDTA
jgi:hypothetical protein